MNDVNDVTDVTDLTDLTNLYYIAQLTRENQRILARMMLAYRAIYKNGARKLQYCRWSKPRRSSLRFECI